MMSKFRLNLQRFADPLPVGGDDGEPGAGHQELELPRPVGGSGTHIMPSHMAPEAWANVEDMLTTLSANVRIQIKSVNDKIDKANETAAQTLSATLAATAELKQTMADFKKLLEEATVEVPIEEVRENEERKGDKKKHQSYLDRRYTNARN